MSATAEHLGIALALKTQSTWRLELASHGPVHDPLDLVHNKMSALMRAQQKKPTPNTPPPPRAKKKRKEKRKRHNKRPPPQPPPPQKTQKKAYSARARHIMT